MHFRATRIRTSYHQCSESVNFLQVRIRGSLNLDYRYGSRINYGSTGSETLLTTSLIYSIYVQDHSFETYLSLCPTMLFLLCLMVKNFTVKTIQVSSMMNKLILNSGKPVQKSKLSYWSKPASKFLNRCLYLEKFSSAKIPHI
jgi:hypothetical protein